MLPAYQLLSRREDVARVRGLGEIELGLNGVIAGGIKACFDASNTPTTARSRELLYFLFPTSWGVWIDLLFSLALEKGAIDSSGNHFSYFPSLLSRSLIFSCILCCLWSRGVEKIALLPFCHSLLRRLLSEERALFCGCFRRALN